MIAVSYLSSSISNLFSKSSQSPRAPFYRLRSWYLVRACTASSIPLILSLHYRICWLTCHKYKTQGYTSDTFFHFATTFMWYSFFNLTRLTLQYIRLTMQSCNTLPFFNLGSTPEILRSPPVRALLREKK